MDGGVFQGKEGVSRAAAVRIARVPKASCEQVESLAKRKVMQNQELVHLSALMCNLRACCAKLQKPCQRYQSGKKNFSTLYGAGAINASLPVALCT